MSENKKNDLFSLPKSTKKGEQLNYKSIGIVIGVVFIIGALTFTAFSRKKDDRVEKKQTYNSSDKIDTSEVVGKTPQEIQKMIDEKKQEFEKNPIEKKEENRLKEIQISNDHEIKKLRLQYEQDRLNRLKAREMQPLSLVASRTINESQKEQVKSIYDGLTIPAMPEYPVDDPNLQKDKKQFLKESVEDNFVLKETLTPAISKYEVKAGTLIPMTLETAINSDLPGNITAVVKRNVYDSATGNILLIPAGSKIIGKYSSNVAFGQERVQAVFNRITLPNQKSINLGSMYAVDKMGASGVKDKVNTKIGKVFSSVLMSAILGVGSGSLKNYDSDSVWRNEAINEGGSQALNVGNTYANKLLQVQPTLTIRNGYTVGIFVDKDLILEPYIN